MTEQITPTVVLEDSPEVAQVINYALSRLDPDGKHFGLYFRYIRGENPIGRRSLEEILRQVGQLAVEVPNMEFMIGQNGDSRLITQVRSIKLLEEGATEPVVIDTPIGVVVTKHLEDDQHELRKTLGLYNQFRNKSRQ